MEVRPGYKQTEIGDIPDDWTVEPIQNIGHIRTGPFGTSLKASEYSLEGTPLISVREISEGYLRVDKHTPLIPAFIVERMPEYILNFGDLVFGRKGAVDRSAMVSENQAGYFLGSDGIRIRPSKFYHAPFIAWQFQRKSIQSWILQHATGTTMASLNQGILRRVSLPIPTLPEQHAIASALSDVDALLAAQDELIAKKQCIKQAAMQELLTGKRRLPGFVGDWDVKRLGDIGSFSKGKGLPKNDIRTSGKLPAIPYTAIYTDFDQVIDYSKVCQFTDAVNGTVIINTPHLLFASSSNMLENIGKVTAYNSNANIAVGGDIILYQTKANVVFLSYLLSTRFHRKRIVFLSQGSTIRHVYASTFQRYEINLPSIDEQTAIAAVLSDMDAEIAALTQKRDKTRLLKQGMMQELLTGKTRLV